MENTRRILTVAILVAIWALSGVSVYAAGPMKMAGKRKGVGIERFAAELNLSDEQLRKIQEIESAQEIEAVGMRSRVKVAEIELRDLMREQEVNESSVIAKVEEIGGLKTALRVANVRSKLAINKILTPEQLRTLRSLDRRRGKRDKNRRDWKKPGREDLQDIDGPESEELDMQLPQPESDRNREI